MVTWDTVDCLDLISVEEEAAARPANTTAIRVAFMMYRLFVLIFEEGLGRDACLRMLLLEKYCKILYITR